ncbi:MmcQ/YjbR family DNA-binding protein [Ornithinimicrobium cavernae]|uniref:MmcQ/YjbR family DNA-binding protein n=1 Tax=Ornithinimicrobium cavernae TaxID=2666047 RepID=UPI00192A3594|nr:MmcQ/YjbR family DNA-binding protein [Ornithinimicrobium cavernae]
MDGVGTSIVGRPRRLSADRRARPTYTLIWEEPPYFKAGWGQNVVGIVLDDDTDWEDLGEMLTDSYCLQAPATLAAQVRDVS